MSFGDRTLKTQDLDQFDFTGWDIALFAIGSDATKQYAPKAAASGCVVIDNSSLYRYEPDVPLIVPEVNPDAVEVIVHRLRKKLGEGRVQIVTLRGVGYLLEPEDEG